MKRNLLKISLASVLLVISFSSAWNQAEPGSNRASPISMAASELSSRAAHHLKLLPAQCPFNVPVVSLPPGSGQNSFNWSSAIVPQGDPCVSGILVDPTDEQRWYVSGFNGLYITRDGGTSWTKSRTRSINNQAVALGP